MKAQHDEFNLILVSGETSPVRRFRLSRERIRAAIIGAAAFALLLSGLLVDYVRLRLEAVDVEKLRAETAEQQRALGELSSEVGTLFAEFDALREFERKVRVIANLPGAVTEADAPDHRAGQGGADEEDASGEVAVPAAQADDARGAPEEPAHPHVDAGDAGFDRVALRRATERARELALAVPPNKESFESLVDALEGKRHQLASTPSVWPTDGWVTSRYGYRTSPFTGRRQFHGGIDIASDFGTMVIAPARGRVAFVGNKGPLGKTVVIDHGFGLKTTFGHNSKTYVSRGEIVERGTPIATVGSTGRSTGPHLHYAVEVEGKLVDPTNYIFE